MENGNWIGTLASTPTVPRAAQREMRAEGMKMNLAYMNLRNEMQAESRAHNALSHIMKIRHDSAKAAIHNIR